jgi:1-acyl-sn-glycerol-3-phosphate acyltransferase
LGSVLPLRFVAKSEVKYWPIIGFLSKLASTVFIKRVKSDSIRQKKEIFKLLSQGKKLLIFPEGTTSDGNRILPFKSSLFSALENQNFIIQPLIIIYSDLNGMPINRWLRPIIAWYGDMDLLPHLSILKNIKSINAKIIYLKPVNTIKFSTRKELSNFLEEQINKAYSSAVSRKKFVE